MTEIRAQNERDAATASAQTLQPSSKVPKPPKPRKVEKRQMGSKG